MSEANEKRAAAIPDAELREQLTACYDDWDEVLVALGFDGHAGPEEVLAEIGRLGAVENLSPFLPAVKLWRAWAELGEFAEKIGPVSFRQPVEEYQRRIAEADRLLALIEAGRGPYAGLVADCTDIANRAQAVTGRSIHPSTVKAILDVIAEQGVFRG